MDSTEEKDRISALDIDGRKSRVFTGRTTCAKLVRLHFESTLYEIPGASNFFLTNISKEIGKPLDSEVTMYMH